MTAAWHWRRNIFDCFEAYGILETNIDLPSDFNNFELYKESSLQAIPTDLEIVILDLPTMKRMRLYSLIPFVFLYAEPKWCKEIIKRYNYFLHINSYLIFFPINIRVIMILGVMNRYTRVQNGPVKTYYLYSKC